MSSAAEYQYLWDCLITDVEVKRESNNTAIVEDDRPGAKHKDMFYNVVYIHRDVLYSLVVYNLVGKTQGYVL